jgi:hypothetical protein
MAIEPAVVCVAAFVGTAEGQCGVRVHGSIMAGNRGLANAGMAG